MPKVVDIPTDFDTLPESRKMKYFSFDPKIDMGHILTFAGMLVAVSVGWNTLDRRLTVTEEALRAGTVATAEKNMQVKESLAELKSDLKEVQRSVNEINRNIRPVEINARKN